MGTQVYDVRFYLKRPIRSIVGKIKIQGARNSGDHSGMTKVLSESVFNAEVRFDWVPPGYRVPPLSNSVRGVRTQFGAIMRSWMASAELVFLKRNLRIATERYGTLPAEDEVQFSSLFVHHLPSFPADLAQGSASGGVESDENAAN